MADKANRDASYDRAVRMQDGRCVVAREGKRDPHHKRRIQDIRLHPERAYRAGPENFSHRPSRAHLDATEADRNFNGRA
jgi:hypothetical protein